ncbi:MAG TPA: energy-coupling factor transporter transmembrane component T [Bacilli bacterium]|nr:energy-coupling factor transporter transmembrane component T [Bacilli bacterium]
MQNKVDQLFTYSLHAGSLLLYPLLLLILAVLIPHPLFLLMQLVVTGVALVLSGGGRSFKRLMQYLWPLLALIVLINALINKNGETLLWSGPDLPWFGELRITWEATLYGLVMVVRMLDVMIASTLYMTWLSPDRALSLASKWAGRSAVTAMLTARLVPYLGEQAAQVGDVMATRGLRMGEGSLWQRLRARQPILNVVLVSSLEGSWQVAEAMEARGYGQGKRTAYSRERWTRTDALLCLTVLLTVGLSIWLVVTETASYHYYPVLQPLADGGSLGGSLVLYGVLLLVPPLLVRRRRFAHGT